MEFLSKACSLCGQIKPTGDFYLRKAIGRTKARLSSGCRECERSRQLAWREENKERRLVRQREWNAQNPDRLRSYDLKKKYGLTLEGYESLLAAQGGVCAICGTSEPRGKGAFHVDHDHVTKAIRGLLCHGCNAGIGNLGDDPARVEAALTYLRSA